jgi:hypothetical protein
VARGNLRAQLRQALDEARRLTMGKAWADKETDILDVTTVTGLEQLINCI